MSLGQVGLMVGSQLLQSALRPDAPPQVLPPTQAGQQPQQMPAPVYAPSQMDVFSFLRQLGLGPEQIPDPWQGAQRGANAPPASQSATAPTVRPKP